MAPVGQASMQAPSETHRSRSTRAMSVTMAASVGQAAWQPLQTMQSAATTHAFFASGNLLANAFTAPMSFGLPVNFPPTASGAGAAGAAVAAGAAALGASALGADGTADFAGGGDSTLGASA